MRLKAATVTVLTMLLLVVVSPIGASVEAVDFSSKSEDFMAQSRTHTYNVTIRACCIVRLRVWHMMRTRDARVSINMDGSPSGYATSYTFTGLTGTHTFTVPSKACSVIPFLKWNTGERNRTITVTSGGKYVAYYCKTEIDEVTIPADKSGLPAPYIFSAAIIVVTAIAATAIYVKHVKRGEEKRRVDLTPSFYNISRQNPLCLTDNRSC